MESLRKYGNPPYTIVLIHGGPGACGEMRPVGEKLAKYFGVLEPLNRALTIDGQINELIECIKECRNTKPVLVGFSWGAWLGILLVAMYPERVRKLILIGCGPLEQHYAKLVYDTRIGRMHVKVRNEFIDLLAGIERNTISDLKAAFIRLSQIVSLSDGYDPFSEDDAGIEFSSDVFASVWKEAAELRKKGRLLSSIDKIQCPVVVIHGNYDPHPIEGVSKPLKNSKCDFQLEILKQCGHKPWIEKKAEKEFYQVLHKHLFEDNQHTS
jgi:pimeloyl-ACP methyl ester carboxylesterase